MFDNVMELYGRSRSCGWVALSFLSTVAYLFLFIAISMVSGIHSFPIFIPSVLLAIFIIHAFAAKIKRARLSLRKALRLLVIFAFSVVICLTYLLLVPH